MSFAKGCSLNAVFIVRHDRCVPSLLRLYPIDHFRKLYRYGHTDIPKMDFDEYRRKTTQDPRKRAAETMEDRRAVKCLASFVTGVGGLYAFKSHLLHYITFLLPARDVVAEARLEVNLSGIPEGKASIIKWRGKPVFVYHRPQSIIEQERAVDPSTLRDPQTDDDRVQKSEWLIVLAICTHLGCVPIANSGIIPGGFFCPCHGSHFDAAGRIRKGPAATNLEIPEYRFVDENTIIIG